MKPGKLLVFLLSGGLFGSGVANSGMTDPARVIGFLDVFGNWDPALLFVMVGVYGVGMLVLRCLGNRSLPSGTSSPIDRHLVIGAAIFGIDWGLGGSVADPHWLTPARSAPPLSASCPRWPSAWSGRNDFATRTQRPT